MDNIALTKGQAETVTRKLQSNDRHRNRISKKHSGDLKGTQGAVGTSSLWSHESSGLDSAGQERSPVKVHISTGVSNLSTGVCSLPSKNLGGDLSVCQGGCRWRFSHLRGWIKCPLKILSTLKLCNSMSSAEAKTVIRSFSEGGELGQSPKGQLGPKLTEVGTKAI